MTTPVSTAPIAIDFVASSLALQAAEGGQAAAPPTSIKLTPRGRQTVRDGRNFDFDPEALASRFRQDGIPIPIDTDHSTVLRGGRGDTPNTLGYVTAVEPRDDGLHGTAEWLDSGKAVLAARTHRFVSPSVQQDAAGKTTWLHSVALVSAPAIAMPALAATQDSAAAIVTLSTIAAALGLTDASDQAALLAALSELRAGGVPPAVHAATLEALAAANSRLASLATETHKREVEAMIEGALKATKILPFEREHYMALCATEGGFQTVKTILAGAIPRLAPSGLDGRKVPDGTPMNAATLSQLATAHRDEQARKGIAISIAEAVRFVEANRA